MTPFKGLLKKEFSITRLWFFTWIIIMLIAVISSYIIAYRMDQPMVPVGFHIGLAVLHFGFLPIMLLSSLKLEGKNQLWLHNPQSSKVLILAKLTALFIYQFISQIILTISGYIVYEYVLSQGLKIEPFPYLTFVTFFLLLLLTGLYFSCWILFYWCIFHSLGKYPGIKKIRWLFILILWFIFNAIETAIAQIDSLRDVVTKWKLSLDIYPRFHYEVTSHKWNLHFDMQPVSIIPIFIYAIIAVTLYFISSWLLDKKVEV
ncbi:hypothetical protein [Heyndrickxia camelliae]|uniref:Uncharacterized protein n=1 Tax=Heyndrickxia camelliae TaxID=1707093 RepID=A0A2N3LKX6_9BACI|nr:hypothetical protein [Heyndrickxia camelliae]PKR85189.1 hypothetical protein CWO92_10565 [Heyndrickxia camelliae]